MLGGMNREVGACNWSPSCARASRRGCAWRPVLAKRSLHSMLAGASIALLAATLGLELAHLRTHADVVLQGALIANVATVATVLAAAAAARGLDHRVLSLSEQARGLATQRALFDALAILLLGAGAVHLHGAWTARALQPLAPHVPLAFGLLGLVALAVGYALDWALTHTHDAPRAWRPRHRGALTIPCSP